jgi:hypothetical protein
MKTKIISLSAIVLLFSGSVFSQTPVPSEPASEPKTNFKVTTDIVSSYIWRGTVGSPDPNIQPTLAIVSGGFEFGVWGSTDYRASYKELDPYLAYTLKNFKIGITDYDWSFANKSYFDYKNSTTDHILEVSLSFLGTENLPLSISLNTMIYGADKKWDKNLDGYSTKQNYSTYIEFGYALRDFNVFLGVTPANGYYGAGYGKIDGFAVCNLGLTSVRNIKISPDFSIPLKGTVYVNPQAESIYFVIGITI